MVSVWQLFVLVTFTVFSAAQFSFAQEIRRVDISEFDGDQERFYREYADAPVIVTGVYRGDVLLNSLTLEKISESFRGRTLFGYQRKNDANGRIREEFPSEVFFEDFTKGATDYYVFDHAVADTPFADQLKIPAFLDGNWLGDHYGFNITISGAGSFTPFHEDGSGEQAWMYLVTGEKQWTIYPPKCRPLLWDSFFKDFYSPRRSHAARFPFLDCARAHEITATARAGDLIFIPPGWIHQVLTTEPSFGLGGNIFNEFMAFSSTETALNEKSHALRHDFDLFELLAEKGEHPRTEYGRDQIAKARQLVDRWLIRVRNKSDILIPRVAGAGESDEVFNAIR